MTNKFEPGDKVIIIGCETADEATQADWLGQVCHVVSPPRLMRHTPTGVIAKVYQVDMPPPPECDMEPGDVVAFREEHLEKVH